MIEHAWQIPAQPTVLWKMASNFTMRLGGLLCKAVYVGNRVNVHNRDVLYSAMDRYKKGLVTVCNHTSCIDDPFLWGMLPLKQLMTPKRMRWTLIADNICCKKVLHAKFFCLGHGVPVCRGDGVCQKGVDFAIERVDAGDWVHIFPEAKVNLIREKIRLKWGVGRVVGEAEETPIVVPMYQIGVEDVFPYKNPIRFMLKLLQRVTVVVGEPMDFTEVVRELKDEQKSAKEIRTYITDRVQERLYELQTEAERVHFKHNKETS